MLLSVKRTMSRAVAALMWLYAPAEGWAGHRSITVLEGVPEPTKPDAGAPQDLGAPRSRNKAGLHIALRPGPLLPVGTPVTLEVTTEKPGYLVIVDINADHEASQIYPRAVSPVSARAAQVTNQLSPGSKVTVPNLKNPLARFELKAERPIGPGVIVALLSERPVRAVDLPPTPLPVTAVQDSIDYLDKTVRGRSAADGEKASSLSSAIGRSLRSSTS